jgi:hypothetical protein
LTFSKLIGRMNIKYLFYFLMLLFVLKFSFAEVVVFDNYETQITMGDGVIHIKRVLTLQNVGQNPIIPGELHFKIHELKKGERVASEIQNFGAINEQNIELKTRVVKADKETDLVVSVWEPILPKFSYKIYLDYDIIFKPKGMLFYEFVVPTEETTIPIKNYKNTVLIPSKYHVTHAPDAIVGLDKNNQKLRAVEWKNTKEMVMEYSILPLPKIGIKAVNLFWGVIIVLTLIITFIVHKKLR